MERRRKTRRYLESQEVEQIVNILSTRLEVRTDADEYAVVPYENESKALADLYRGALGALQYGEGVRTYGELEDQALNTAEFIARNVMRSVMEGNGREGRFQSYTGFYLPLTRVIDACRENGIKHIPMQGDRYRIDDVEYELVYFFCGEAYLSALGDRTDTKQLRIERMLLEPENYEYIEAEADEM